MKLSADEIRHHEALPLVRHVRVIDAREDLEELG